MINAYIIYLCILSGVFGLCFVMIALTYFFESFKDDIARMRYEKKKEKIVDDVKD